MTSSSSHPADDFSHAMINGSKGGAPSYAGPEAAELAQFRIDFKVVTHDPLHRMNNPHMDQAFPGWIQELRGGTHHQDLSTPLCRILGPDAPSKPYQRRQGLKKTVLHWGQRKLLFSEIEFLTLYGQAAGCTVLYAGAAPGTHVDYLCELFPTFHFILVDPEDFTVRAGKQVTIRQECFTLDMAQEYSDIPDLLFISDIRTADPARMTPEEVEVHVAKDNQRQMEWHLALNPVRSMLKFRLNYSNFGMGETRYLDGDVYLPIWGPQTTTETRLVPFGKEIKDWDNKLYEEQMFYFNTQTRVQW